jgi:hypothetical protein
MKGFWTSGKKVMERPDNKKGALVIRTKFGEVSAEQGVNFNKIVEDMNEDEAWRKAVEAEGGVFCYTHQTRNIPF